MKAIFNRKIHWLCFLRNLLIFRKWLLRRRKSADFIRATLIPGHVFCAAFSSRNRISAQFYNLRGTKRSGIGCMRFTISGGKNAWKFWSLKLKGGNYFQNVGVNLRIILNHFLGDTAWWSWVDSDGPVRGPLSATFKHINELLRSLKGGEFNEGQND